MAPPSRARRLAAAASMLIVVASGLLVHALGEGAAGDIAGDALYAAAVYGGVVLLAPRLPPAAVAGIAAAGCAAVELFQLTGLPSTWAATFRPVALVLGSGFDARDLVVYLAAAAAAAGVDALSAGRLGRLPRR